jgi:hypothetical protein
MVLACYLRASTSTANARSCSSFSMAMRVTSASFYATVSCSRFTCSKYSVSARWLSPCRLRIVYSATSYPRLNILSSSAFSPFRRLRSSVCARLYRAASASASA